MAINESKEVLILEMQAAHDQFTRALKQLDGKDLLHPHTWGEWTFKDMLAHITDWEERNFRWYLAGLRGESPVTPDPDFDWEHIDDLNHAIYLKHRDEPLDGVLAGFDLSWQDVLRLVKDIPDDHLFRKGEFAWLGEYLWADVMLGSTTHHYLEHLKDIQARLKRKALRG